MTSSPRSRSLVHPPYIAVTRSDIWYVTATHNIFNIYICIGMQPISRVTAIFHSLIFLSMANILVEKSFHTLRSNSEYPAEFSIIIMYERNFTMIRLERDNGLYGRIRYTLPAKNMESFLFHRIFAFLRGVQGVSVLEIHPYEQILLLGELISA